MEITDILARLGGVESMARELGVSQEQAATGAEALVPAILGGFKKQAQGHPAGLEGLGGLLGQLGGGDLLEDVLSSRPTNVGRGNEVLGEIFGSKEVSRAVAQDASSKTGLDPALLKKMLPVLAMLVAGFMAKRQGTGGAGGSAPAAQGAAPGAGGLGGLQGLVGGLLGGLAGAGSGGVRSPAPAAAPGLASLLDLDHDGNPLDDILKAAGKALR